MTVPHTGRQNDQVENSGSERAKSKGTDVNGSERLACPAMPHDKEGSRLRTLTHKGKPKGQEENTKTGRLLIFILQLKKGKTNIC